MGYFQANLYKCDKKGMVLGEFVGQDAQQVRAEGVWDVRSRERG